MYKRLLCVVIVLSWLTGAGFFVLGNVTEVAAGEDTTPPVITLCGGASVSIEVYSDYEDPGATAADDIDGDISASITVGGTVDTTQVGSYTLTYDVTDAAGNAAETVSRTVYVVEAVPDTEPPVITLLGDNPLQLTQGSTYVEPGYIAVDDVDGDLTDRVSVTGNVYTDTPGTYTLIYAVADAAGNTAEVTRTVDVTESPLLEPTGFFGAESLSKKRITAVFPNFSSPQTLQINFDAAVCNNSVLRLTPALGTKHGSAFLTNKVSLDNNSSFSTYFTFQITGWDSESGGADGFCFVIQPNSSTVGSSGGGLGYANISNSLAIEFDTYNNNEISDNHVGVDLNGSTDSVLSVNLYGQSINLQDGQVKYAWVDYNSTINTVEVRLSNSSTRPDAAILTYGLGAQTLRSIIGQDEAYVGFTAATGGSWENHDILSWYFSNQYDPIDLNQYTYVTNIAPVTNDQTISTSEDKEFGGTLTATDGNGDPVSFANASDPDHGTVTINTDGTFTYRPASDFNGMDTFTFMAKDSYGGTDIGNVSITVTAVDDPPVVTASGTGPTYVEKGAAVEVASGITVTDADGPDLTGAKVSITGGFASGEDWLDYTTTAGISGSYDDDSGVLTLTGSGTATDYEAAFRAVKYRNSSDNPSAAARTIVFAIGNNTLFCPANAHYYEFVSSYGTGWDIARANAEDKSLYGLRGYLATITSAQENAFVTGKLHGVGWIGASDAGAEDTWKWVTGPEEGTVFWTRNEGTKTYANWNSGEPNNSGGNEHYGHMIFNPNIGTIGSWNDLPVQGGGGDYAPQGYVVEYGGMPGDPALQLTADVTVNVQPQNDPPTISDIADQTTNEDTPTTAIAFIIGDPETPAADLQVTGSSSNTTLVPNYGIGFSGSGANRTVTVTPAHDRYGSATLTVTVSDGQDTVSETFLLTVNPVNDPPVAVDDNVSTDENASIQISLMASDADGGILTYSIVDGPSHGTLEPIFGNKVRYNPNSHYHGQDSLTFRVSDGLLESNTALINITVNPVNDLPDPQQDAMTAFEDTPLIFPAIDLTRNDSDYDNDTLTVTAVFPISSSHCTVGLSDGMITYLSELDYSGPDTFWYTVSDNNGGTQNGTVKVTVTPVNDAPVAVDGNVNTDEDTPVEISLSASDIDSGSLTYSIISGPSHGSLGPIDGNRVTYTPDSHYHGLDTFTFKASDGSLDSNTATIRLTINTVNDAPVAADDSYSVNEDETLTVSTSGVLGNDSDVDDEALTATLATGPSNGTLSLNTDGSFTYIPDADFSGSDSFTYRANDGTTNSGTATVSITVNPVNDPPNNTVAPSVTGKLHVGQVVTTVNGTWDDSTDLHPGILTYTYQWQRADDSSGTNAADIPGAIGHTYTVDTADNGKYLRVRVTAADDGEGTPAKMSTTVPSAWLPVTNAAPVISEGASIDVTMDEDASETAISLTLNAADADGDTITWSILSQAGHGTAEVGGSGDFKVIAYAPVQDYNGDDSFVVQVSDGLGGTDTITVNVRITPVNDAPVAVDGNVNTDEDTPVEISLSASDIDSGSLTYSIISGPSHGSLGPIDGNRVTYTPDSHYHGLDTFTFKASDGSLDSNTATIRLTIAPVNDAPWISAIADRLTENSGTVKDIPLAIGDIDDDANSLTVSARSSDQSIVTDDRLTITGTAGTRALTIVPSGRVGTTAITVTVSDGELVASESFVLTTYRDKRDEVSPATTGLSSSDFIARWEDSIPLQVKPVKVMGPQPEITLRASDAGDLTRAAAQGLEPRVYVWNEKFKKWVALASYRQADGSVKALNDHNYTGWMTVFAIRQPRFLDVKPTDWFEPVLNRANGLALLEGYAADPQNPDGLERFAKPRAAMTRAEYVTMITRALGLVGEDQIPMYRILPSVPPGDVAAVLDRFTDGGSIPRWCRSSIAAALRSDLLKDVVGMQDSFSPATPINRLQAAVIVSNALAELPGYEYKPADLSAFSDAARIPAWAEGRVAEGVIVGDANGCFQPDAPLTRAEAYTLFLRLLRDLGW